MLSNDLSRVELDYFVDTAFVYFHKFDLLSRKAILESFVMHIFFK